jgi:hypothetical protein
LPKFALETGARKNNQGLFRASLVRTETKFKVKTEAVINPGNNQQMIYVKGSAAEVDAFVKKLF